ncbi:MAG: hypothetical protein A2Z88_03810 [Omnitrophica WOR_2 bacterium GWA2_47_8]|nr:MAG: hypothetical protein A2Z88_03810 [Omnitrophica WOR_2 bacterium GWA2_47_8]
MSPLRYPILSLVLMLSLFACTARSTEDQVCFKRNCVDVSLAQTHEAREQGLKFVTRLEPNRGMLFIFPKSGQNNFWMKETMIPLDIIWMDYARRIIHIERNVPPCAIDPCPTYGPKKPALYVLEVNANHAQEMGLRLGGELEFKLKD